MFFFQQYYDALPSSFFVRIRLFCLFLLWALVGVPPSFSQFLGCGGQRSVGMVMLVKTIYSVVLVVMFCFAVMRGLVVESRSYS